MFQQPQPTVKLTSVRPTDGSVTELEAGAGFGALASIPPVESSGHVPWNGRGPV